MEILRLLAKVDEAQTRERFQYSLRKDDPQPAGLLPGGMIAAGLP
jgi:hypothetical protein